MSQKLKLIASGVMAFAVTAGASASIVELTGTGFKLSYDSTQSTLFGTPTLTENTLTFDLSALTTSAASDTNRASTLASSFAFDVLTNPGYTLTALGLTAGFDYIVSGGSSKIGGAVELFFGDDSTGLDFSTRINSSTASGTVTGGGSIEGFTGDFASFVLDASLFADTNGRGADKVASISLNDLSLSVSTVAPVPPVPEPEAYMMLLAGLGLVGAVARRRSKSQ